MSRPMSHDEYLARGFMASLDGVRAVSVLAVMSYHAGGGAWSSLNGGRGVEVFFLLSGYLITTLCLREEARRGRVDIRAFFVRRVFRILPLFFLVLGSYTVLVLALHIDGRRHAFAHALPYYAGYLEEWPVFHAGPQGLPFGVAWSLGIEEKFYVVWPLLAFWLLRKRAGRGWIAVLTAVCFTTVATIHPLGVGQMVVHYSAILLGCALALLLHNPHCWERISPLQRREVLPIGLVVVAILWLVPMPDLAPFVPVPSQLGFLLPVLVVFCALVMAGESADAKVPRLLLKVGQLSYGIYLTHQLVFQAIGRVLPDSTGSTAALVELTVGLPVTMVLCAVLNATVERPLILWGRRWSRSHQPHESPSEV
jgi:peptidoglycan/LPS O-acetylase OafA/YrhL